jgi:hypothetical protein
MTIQEFVTALNQKFARTGYVFTLAKSGPKYTRIVRSHTSSISVFCFIDHDGNIYKAASWKAPAKGIRATLATVDDVRVDQYGAWLYR